MPRIYKFFYINQWLLVLKFSRIYSPEMGEYGESVKLTCINCLFSNFLFRVHYENSTNTVDYGSRGIICHALFSENYDAGHF